MGAGMLDRVVQRLLRHSIQRLLSRLGQVRFPAEVHPDLKAMAGLHGRHLLFQRAHQALAL